MSNTRVWLFRVLILVAVGLMLLSWFMPWWSADTDAFGDDTIVIRPWTLENHLPPNVVSILKTAEMPAYFEPLMWAYLGICVAALLFSLFASGKRVGLGRFKFSLPKFIIGLVGFSFIVIVAMAVVVAAIRTGDFYDVKLIGYTYIAVDPDMGAATGVHAGLLFGYWLACAVGPLLIILALFRNRIIGKT